jgi:RimJ/RimL family protein N-acetyltransferase
MQTQLQSQANYAYQQFDHRIKKKIAFREVKLEEDLGRIQSWMNQPHVIPFWNLALDLEHMRSHLEKALEDTHQTLYIGYLDDVPMSYWESYWAKDDIIARCYAPHPQDQGIHLLIGEPAFLGKGYALPLLRAMTAFQLQECGTKKIVSEPDIRNKKMIHVFERCGFEFQREIQLPDKKAALMFCDRQSFMEQWG